VYRRMAMGLLCCSFLLSPGSPVSASEPVEAFTLGMVSPEPDPQGGHTARVTFTCNGTGNENTVSMRIVCELWDSSGIVAKQIRRERIYTGPACTCFINAFNMKMPVEFCATVYATMRDSTVVTAQQCTSYTMLPGDPDVPHLSPPPNPPRYLECIDPVAAENTVWETVPE
jgi:hypothetical protein